MKHFALLTTLILFCTSTAIADDKKSETYTDSAKAGADYENQGEYSGVSPDGSTNIGLQLIAVGDGKFKGTFFIGGLPGDGWSRGDMSISIQGETKDGAVKLQADDKVTHPGYGELKEGKITIFDGDGNNIGELSKKERKSPTLGKKPPEGAIVLFDGSSADKFENGKLVGKYLGATNCSSKEKLGDHTLHIEFRTPFMPKASGQARGNSGVYVQSRYEVQVLDSFGLSGKNNECGGIYSIGEPSVNMCFPPLTWQTYDIDFTAAKYEDGKKVKNARVTVKHNGVTIHDDVELTKGTPGCKPEGESNEGVFMQNHGNPVVFGNIWVVKK